MTGSSKPFALHWSVFFLPSSRNPIIIRMFSLYHLPATPSRHSDRFADTSKMIDYLSGNSFYFTVTVSGLRIFRAKSAI